MPSPRLRRLARTALKIRQLSLPIPTATPAAALILPLLTGIGVRGAQSFLTGSEDALFKRQPLRPWALPVLYVVLVIYESVIATLAITQMLPSDALTCGLSQRWQSLWSTHNADAIKRIQDAHNCCGFRTTKDRSWPMRGNQGADTCRIMYGRERSCLSGWRQDQQIYAGLLLLVAIGTFLVQGGVLVLYRGRRPFMASTRRDYATLAAGENDVEDGNRDRDTRRRQGRIEAAYRDEITSDAGTEEVDTGKDERAQARTSAQRQHSNLVVQPSGIREDGNEWRE
ncbi:MAG: hypothetical protein Q9219_006258 [cf. Caloplaca sp. 3 TL-2023]